MYLLGFTIHGNQEKSHGNPIPYHRTTQKSVWNKASKRYNAWKQYVLTSAMLAKPLVIPHGSYIVMSVAISWANKAHGDADNVFKGIADSLFVNDKEIREGHFITLLSPDKCGSVDIYCEIFSE